VKNGYNGLLTIPKNTAEIADKIVEAFTQFDFEEMDERVRQIVQKYYWEEIREYHETNVYDKS